MSFSQETANMESQLNFEFCQNCGAYLLPEKAQVVIEAGQPIVLCSECSGLSSSEAQATEFEKKYNL